MTQASLWADGHWRVVDRCDVRARRLVDGESVGRAPHYSRQTPGATNFLANGRTLVLMTADNLAVWGVIEMLGWSGARLWRCAVFRNEPPRGQERPIVHSSELVREATARTYEYWRRHYGGVPSVPLRTEVDPEKTRRKRDPGRCYLKAGWVRVGETGTGKVVLEAPAQ